MSAAPEEPSAKKAKAAASADASKAGEKLDARAQAADKAKDTGKGKDEKKPGAAAAAPMKGLDLDDRAAPDTVVLISQEKKEFKVAKRAAMQSHLVKTALEEDKDAKDVQLVHISAPIVEKVIQYMNYHMDAEPRRIESPLKSTNMKELVDRFDANFVDEMDLDTLMRVLLAANYMDVKSLLGLLCAKIASMMKGKTADQIRKTFNIRGEFTPEEEEEIRRDFKELLVE